MRYFPNDNDPRSRVSRESRDAMQQDIRAILDASRVTLTKRAPGKNASVTRSGSLGLMPGLSVKGG